MSVGGHGDLASQSSLMTGSAHAVDLAAQSNESFPDVHPEITKGRQRWAMLIVVGLLFVALNAAVIWLIRNAMNIDVAFSAMHPELVEKRIITSAVFETLIGATVVQTGAVTWAMARYLFPNQPED